jgi:hypothetical protein
MAFNTIEPKTFTQTLKANHIDKNKYLHKTEKQYMFSGTSILVIHVQSLETLIF